MYLVIQDLNSSQVCLGRNGLDRLEKVGRQTEPLSEGLDALTISFVATSNIQVKITNPGMIGSTNISDLGKEGSRVFC